MPFSGAGEEVLIILPACVHHSRRRSSRRTTRDQRSLLRFRQLSVGEGRDT